MDTRNLIAFAMLLSVVVAALMKGAIAGNDVKEVIILLSGWVIGFTVPRTAKPAGSLPTPPPAVMMLLVGAVLLMVSCYHGSPPWPGDPTAPPPPFQRCHQLGARIDVDSGVRDDAGTWRYRAAPVSQPCPDGGTP